MSHALMNTYAPLPVSFTHGDGAWLFDTEGRRYLDALAGIAVNGLGHAHPRLLAAINEQAQRMIHVSNLYTIDVQQQLGAALCKVAGMESCFFGNSGAEANEAAIKLARLYGHQRGIDKPTIIVMERAFHGRTLATLTATGNRKIQAGFEPLVAGFTRAPFNDIEAVRQIGRSNRQVVAVMLEPIQGEGGVHPADADYLQQLRALCDEQGWLLMFDEVQSGNGRTGTFFAYQGYGVIPDVVSTAKGLGNGVPIGACLARGAAAAVFEPGHHGSTYGGNPLACAAGLAVLTALTEEGLMANAASMGDYLCQQLTAALADLPVTTQIRGRGLMLGVEIDGDCSQVVQTALDKGLLLNVTAGNTIRLLPPLMLNREQARQIATTVAEVVAEAIAAPAAITPEPA